MKKEVKKKSIKVIIEFSFLISLAILIYGTNVFWIGFHNLDICHNEMVIQNMVNKKFNKLNVSDFIIRETKVYDGEIWSLNDCYRNGLKGIVQGFYISIVGAFLVSYTKGRLI